MDRPTHSLVPHRRAPLRLNAVDCGRALFCRGAGFGQCMRNGMPALLDVALQAGVLVLAVWTGSEVGRRVKSTWVGLATGTVIFFA